MSAKKTTKKTQGDQAKSLPQFVQEQLEIINSLQKRIDKISKDFKTEMACKNQVYFFILENGYFDEYVKYSKQNPVVY